MSKEKQLIDRAIIFLLLSSLTLLCALFVDTENSVVRVLTYVGGLLFWGLLILGYVMFYRFCKLCKKQAKEPLLFDLVKWNQNTIPINESNIAKCIIVSIVTCGVYLIYWEYLLVKNTRAINNDKSNCIGEMLCLIFVPFYSLYWWFTRGERVREKFATHRYSAKGKGIIYLILGIFGLDIISMAIMQNDFNSLKTETSSNNSNRSNRRNTRSVNQKKEPGIMVFFSNPAARKADIVMILSLFASIVLVCIKQGVKGSNPAFNSFLFEFISVFSFAVFILAAQLHAILNGVNYRYYLSVTELKDRNQPTKDRAKRERSKHAASEGDDEPKRSEKEQTEVQIESGSKRRVE